eukprot:CAMPEP_0115476682 /NCGR_PEP_ID=MMETSP0271-20121206/55266_1 /TAXON_ID=71861 /ORGANISM="Scrippsiella trochoidea, Strain CCMP3099" /LENGTH=156 /DNA_ID=CAMNT_0002904109 /DNA_START=46 /DNA_END=516 /DNA_ORIENTATION=+
MASIKGLAVLPVLVGFAVVAALLIATVLPRRDWEDSAGKLRRLSGVAAQGISSSNQTASAATLSWPEKVLDTKQAATGSNGSEAAAKHLPCSWSGSSVDVPAIATTGAVAMDAASGAGALAHIAAVAQVAALLVGRVGPSLVPFPVALAMAGGIGE